MKRVNGQLDVVASGFFVLRTPLLPFSEFIAWGEDLEAPACGGDAQRLEDALARDRARLRERLAQITARPEVREAIFVASPSLDAALGSWRRDADANATRKAERSLVAYFSRAAARPTPFGLFAGCTTGARDSQTRLRLEGRDSYRRHTRLDMDYLWTLAEALEREPRLRRSFLYRPNSSLYEVGERIYFAEAGRSESGRSYQLVAVDKTPYLTATIKRAKSGQRLEALAGALVDGEITQTDAEEFLEELVDSEILVSDARPQLTGEQPVDVLTRTLSHSAQTAPIAERLDDARGQLTELDSDGLGASPDRYRAVASALDDLPASPKLSRLVQVDLIKPARALSLGENVIAEVVRGVRALHAFARAGPPLGLLRFREEFIRRYETREVPLLEALDEENGIGFERSDSASAEAASLLEGLSLSGVREPEERWRSRESLLLAKLTRALTAGSSVITIDSADVAAMLGSEPLPLPDAFEVMASIDAASEEDVDRGAFRVLVQSASGPPGARLLGRFCHLDARLHQLVVDHLRAEESQHPDCVYAEVVHLPEGRVGNILTRPVLRDYEIPYLGRSGAPRDRQLPVSDLLVSVQGERIVLRSRRLGRRVIPRLTAAHNHAWRSLGLYRFLCALQHQTVAAGVMWDWGPLGSAPFLPRVVHGRAVLSRARWNLSHDEIEALCRSEGGARFAAVRELRATRAIPRYVALADADNELVADLDNVLSIDALVGQIKRRPAASLLEVLPGPESLCVSGPEGRFAHQLIIPFARRPARRSSVGRRRHPTASLPRRFLPGSEWLYVKLFCGTASADRVLGAAARAVQSSLASGAADRWFFIRYADPDWHVRLRVHGAPQRLLQETLPSIYAWSEPLLRGGALWRVQLDAYEREIERYGGERGIEVAESIFHADSECVLAIIAGLDGGTGSTSRWRTALLGIDRLFDDFGLTLDERRAVSRRACEAYGREFRAGGAFQKQLSHRYRHERDALEALLEPGQDPPEALRPVFEALRWRSIAITPNVAELRRLAGRGELCTDLFEIVMSYVHMHVNRLLRSAQRAQEYVLYELLDRIYSSQAARSQR